MKNKALIEYLSNLPDVEVKILYDGEPRSGVHGVWLSRKGEIIICCESESIYTEENLPMVYPDEIAKKVGGRDE